MDRATIARRLPLLLLAALAIVHLVATVLLAVPGYLTVDEVVYHFISESLVDHGQLHIWNGYDELASAELASRFVTERGGLLVASYPPGFAILSAPLYRLGGLSGLLATNAIAFIGVVASTYGLTRRLRADRTTAVAAAAIFALATFAWEYSQAVWPHMVSLLLICAAVQATVAALSASGRTATVLALAAGLSGGLAVVVRLDAVFAGAAVVLPHLLRSPPRWRLSAVAALGYAPALLGLALANQARFGSLDPLSYGPGAGGNTGDVSRYLPVVVGGLIAGAFAWVVVRQRAVDRIGARRLAIAGAAVALLALALVPTLRTLGTRLATGAYQILIDFRPDTAIAETTRGPTGSVIFYGGIKKALLQSCPYLAALPLALAAVRRRPEVGGWLLVPVLAAAPFALVFAYLAWHGGMSLNMRYLLPVLPFAAILVAVGLRELTLHRRGAVVALAIAVPAGLGAGLALDLAPETRLLLAPLWLAAAAAVASIASLVAGERRASRWLRPTTAAIVGLCLGWSTATAFGHDYRWSQRMRARNAEVIAATRDLVAADSLLLTTRRNPMAAHLGRGVRIAQPLLDDWAGFRALVDHHLAAGRPVYLAASPLEWRRLRAAGGLAGLEAFTLWERPELELAELVPVGRPRSR